MELPSRAGVAEWRRAALGDADAVETAWRDGEDVIVVRHWRHGHDTTIVLVHGIGMGAQYFGLLREELEKSFDVIALDLPGFGSSPEPSRALSMTQLADLVAGALRDTLDGPVVAVGHSMGTQVVAELAVRHPDLVERLVLIAPTVNPKERNKRMQALRLLQDLSNDPPIVALVGAGMYAQTGPRWYWKKLEMMMRHDIRDALPHIRVPTLVVRGEEDLVVPGPWAAEVAAGIRGAQLRIAAGKGHEAMVTGAEPVARMLHEFVQRVGVDA